MEEGDEFMIYAVLMTAGILEFIFALLLVLEFFDMEAEKEAEYQEGYISGYHSGYLRCYDDHIEQIDGKNFADYYDALVDESNYWFGMDGDSDV